MPYGFSAVCVSARKEAIASLGRALQPREDHRRERAVGAADVVVEDLVHACLGRRGGDVDLVPADDRVREVREPAVPAVLVAARCLDDLVAPAVRPRVRGVDRVVEADEPSDHAHALLVQGAHGVREVVARLDRVDLVRERDGRVPADDAALLLHVELDGVDLPLVDQVEHALPEVVVRPRARGDVHRPDRDAPACAA